ncbi:suppressor of loss of ypt1 [Mortierella antarctica]|nr:suppressor of loss of ypt1 [Mortierella antarctica]
MAAAATASPLDQQQQEHFPSTKAHPSSAASSTSPLQQRVYPAAHHGQGTSFSAGPVATSTANILMEFESLVDQNHGSTDDLAHQLPTPRSSLSSGASSPPENVSPTTHTPAQAHPHSPTHTRSQQPQLLHHQLAHTHPSHHTPPIHLTSSLTSTPPSGTGLQSAIAPPVINHGSHSNSSSNAQVPYTRSPLGYQTQPFASFRSSSPVLSSTLGPALVIPPPTSTHEEGASTLQSTTLGSSLHIMHGGGAGGAMSMTTATSPTAATLGGRSHFQAQLQQLNSEIQQQQKHQHQQHQLHLEQERLLEDEREMQKKNARSAISSVSAFLPPALNQSLTKVVQSAKDVVNPMASHSKMSLPSTRLSTISESSSSNNGIGGVGTSGVSSSSAYAPRSRLRLSPRTIWHAIKLPVICLCWYMSSAVTNNIGKQIMNQFRYPVTLTFVQFWFVSVFCFVAGVGFNMTKMRKPTRAIVELTAPLVGFQVVGHVFSSVAISRVPLSVVHTVKALTPLFTVLFYRVVLGTTYSQAVYLSLVPLTAGVMLACRMSLEFNNMVGLCCALLSTLVFVMQNVFTKKILSSNSNSKTKPQQQPGEHHGMGGLGNHESIYAESGSGEGSGGHQKLDKINILFYSSTMAAVCMIPMWLYTEGWTLMFSEDPLGRAEGSTGTWVVISWLLFLNGVSHFFQNFLAFSVLALTSPVTYSIASLIKRIVVIIASIVYFHQTLGTTQWTGVCLTFWGLWMYNSAKNAAKVNPASGILASTKVGRRMSRGFTRGLLDAEMESGSSSRSRAGFMV